MQNSKKRYRLKYLSVIDMGQSPPSESYVNDVQAIPFLQGTAEFGNRNPSPRIFCNDVSKLCKKGDLLFSVRAPVGELNIADQIYGIGRGLCAIRGNELSTSEFLYWALHEAKEQLRSFETGSTYAAVTVEDIGNMRIYPFELSEQANISAFLEKEVGFLQKLIHAKEAQLVLLAEKKQTLVTEVVTKGLNQKTTKKESGIDWIGKIPENWKIERSRWLFQERNERSKDGEEDLLTVSHITGVTLRSEKDVNMFEAETNEGYKICKAGDLVINTLWAWMGAMGVAPIDGIVSPAYHVYTPKKALLPEYVDAIVRTPMFASEVTRYSKGVWSSRLRLYPEGFYETYWPVPPIEEQAEIVAYIKSEISKIDSLKMITEHSIKLLNEKRTALITAAVTGQINPS